MDLNERLARFFSRDDRAVSPVIAVILMVAITVVLAATVYVWVSGFGAQGEQAPAASFKITNCAPSGTAADETITVKLISAARALEPADLRVEVSNQGTGAGAGDWTIPAGTWDVGTSKVLDDTTDTNDLTADTTYVVDIVHTPSGNIIGSPQVTC